MLYPQAIVKKQTSAPACVLPVLDQQIVTGGSPTITTADQLTFNIANFTGAPFGANGIIFYSSTDLLSLENVEWITANFTINSCSLNQAVDLSLSQFLFNQDFNIADPLTYGNSIQLNLASETLAGIDAVGARFLGLNFNFQSLAAFNDLSSFFWDEVQMNLAFNPTTRQMAAGLSLANSNEIIGGYSETLILPASFTELYWGNNITWQQNGIDIDINVSHSWTPGNQIATRPNAANACNVVNANPVSNVVIPTIKTGQTISYTPGGYTAQDDGGEKKGRLNKASSLFDYTSPNPFDFLPFAVYYRTNQYSGNSVIAWGTQSQSVSNAVAVINKLGLMFNSGAIDQSWNFAWDDTAGGNDDIFAYCDAANAANLSGHNDWRLANINEVLSMVTYNAQLGGVGILNPDGTQPNKFFLLVDKIWTSTTAPSFTTQAFTLQQDGTLARQVKTSVVNDAAPLLVRDLYQDSQ